MGSSLQTPPSSGRVSRSVMSQSSKARSRSNTMIKLYKWHAGLPDCGDPTARLVRKSLTLVVRNVGVKNGRIALITDGDDAGARTIDATGHAVVPGFINTHSHSFALFEQRMMAHADLPDYQDPNRD